MQAIGLILMIWVWLFIILMVILCIINKFLVKRSISKNSLLYNKILELNKKYNNIFLEINNKKSYNYYCNSLQTYRNSCSEDAVLEFISNIISNDLDKWYNLVNLVYKNKTIYKTYLKEYKKIYELYRNKSYLNVRKEVYFLSESKYLNLEYKLCEDIDLHPVRDLEIIVSVTYTSPAGRRHYECDYILNLTAIEDVFNYIKDKDQRKNSNEYQRSLMTYSKRYDILKRDGFKCQICGRTQADGAKLEVDHIIPVSKGGKTIDDNLQTLCHECNQGKKAKL